MTSRLMHPEQRRATTAERIASGRLPIPRWLTVHPGSGITGECDGCGDRIKSGDYAFTMGLQQSVVLKFHDECFDVYNRRDWRVLGKETTSIHKELSYE